MSDTNQDSYRTQIRSCLMKYKYVVCRRDWQGCSNYVPEAPQFHVSLIFWLDLSAAILDQIQCLHADPIIIP